MAVGPGWLSRGLGNSAGTKLVPKNPDQLARPQTATERSLIWTGAVGKASDGTEVVGTPFCVRCSLLPGCRASRLFSDSVCVWNLFCEAVSEQG